MGVSKGGPGRGIGAKQSAQIVASLLKSKAAQTGLLSDLSNTTLFIDGIARDKISDLVTNLIRRELAEYTQRQCELHGITKLEERNAVAPLWSRKHLGWKSEKLLLPIVKGKPVLLVPKHFVRHDLSLVAQYFYDKIIIDFLRSEHLSANSSLVHVLKNGDRRVLVKDIKQTHPFSKELIFEMAQKHHELLQKYKKMASQVGPLTTGDMDEGFFESSFATAAIETLKNIPAGKKDASAYHNFMVGILTFLLHPDLTNPRKEAEINDGRKRIDIRYDNSGFGSFFARILMAKQTQAIQIPVECKNYHTDVKNPEIDQMIGRFSPRIGSFGIIVSRKVDDPIGLKARLKDAATNQGAFIVHLDDEIIIKMLNSVADGRRNEIQSILESLFGELLT
ncbi:hypothetical protein ACQKH5_08405 [Hyphomonas sp. NPDC076900]|uniref:hypothetical protein n=1 Tax=unclassified Hyphomonas TaxID=2630699 RepID=UPI003D04426F